MARPFSTRSSLACLPCRNQHLRCDTAQPTCSRCLGLSRPCYYPESRRTGRHRATPARRAAETTSRVFITGAPGPSIPSIDDGNSNFLESPEPSIIHVLNTRPRQGPAIDPFLSLYYQYFHSSHPFVLPRPALERAISADTATPSVLHLATTMRYIGSFYASTPSDLPAVPDGTPDGLSIQTTLLLSLAHSMCSAQTTADQLLARAIEQASSIGMHTSAFAKATEEFDPVLAESWRRTWWTMYVTHLNYAVIRRDYATILNGADYNVDLPCEEGEYNLMVRCWPTPTPLHSSDRRNRSFRRHASQSETMSIKNFPLKKAASRLSPTSSMQPKFLSRCWETRSSLTMCSKQRLLWKTTRPQ